MTQAELHELGAVLYLPNGDGPKLKYVPDHVYERVTSRMRETIDETVAFARAHGLTDEMWAEWKAR